MTIIRITKEDVKKAEKARKAALKKDSELRAFEEELERQMKEAMKQQEKEEKS